MNSFYLARGVESYSQMIAYILEFLIDFCYDMLLGHFQQQTSSTHLKRLYPSVAKDQGIFPKFFEISSNSETLHEPVWKVPVLSHVRSQRSQLPSGGLPAFSSAMVALRDCGERSFELCCS